jgi:multiple sugar transport system permease protein
VGGSSAEARAAWWLLSPALAAIGLFFAVPLLAALFLSLTDFDLYGIADLGTVRFVGLGNYTDLLADPRFWRAVRNTLVFAILGGPLTIAAALFGAVLVDSKLARFRGFFRTVYFAPVVTTLVAAAVVWRAFLHPTFGPVNRILSAVGIHGIDWLGDPRWATLAIVSLSVWRTFGYCLVIFVAGLQSIPVSLYEAARLEGAGTWRLTMDITLPLLRPTTFFVAVITSVGLFQIFAEPYVITRGGPLEATTSLALMMYDQGFRWWSLGRAAAIAFLLFILILAASAIQLALRKMRAEES